ncbi:MAG: hypothetical protein IKE63_03510 [Bacilli bacterium]|nr:hypothetical protein [Bacilli bacterium]
MNNNENIELLNLDENTKQLDINVENLGSSSTDRSILVNDEQSINNSTNEKPAMYENESNLNKSTIAKYMLSCALLIVCLGGSLSLYNRSKINNSQYVENSSVNYQVCLKNNNYYKSKCLNEGTEYITSLTDSIRVDFNYNGVYQEKIEKDYSYYVKSSIIVTPSEENDRELYKKTTKLTKIESNKINGNVINIVQSVEVPFAKSSLHAQKYINEYSLIGDSKLLVALVIKDTKGETEVASLNIPLNKLTYSITKNELKNSVNQYETKSNNLLKYVFLILTIALGIATIIVAYKLLDYIKKNRSFVSKYNYELKKILDTYDRVIVTLTDTTTIVNENEIYDVQTFLELLDVRDTIDKPILYHKASETKAEFYVQDIDKTYLFTMKEADFTSK